LAVSLLVASISVSLSLAAGEWLLRRAGWGPFRALKFGSNEPTMHEPEPELGWWMKPGEYVMPAALPGAPSTRWTILPDHSRATRAQPVEGGTRLALVGCSYTQGWAVSDTDTFAWKLQERFPQLDIGNYGTGGYGTLQSLLMLERLFDRPNPPRLVIYGLIELHELRNVADPDWQMSQSLFARRGEIELPYCTIESDGSLRRHPPEGFPHWPLREQLATVAQLEFRYNRWRGAGRSAQARQVTEQLLLEMQRLCERHGAVLLVALLDFNHEEAKAHYTRFLRDHGVDAVDCTSPVTRDLVVPLDGHPNGRMHTRYADCVSDALRTRRWVDGAPPDPAAAPPAG
jgi:hypothetical protein